jgi:hypothetical protein
MNGAGGPPALPSSRGLLELRAEPPIVKIATAARARG